MRYTDRWTLVHMHVCIYIYICIYVHTHIKYTHVYIYKRTHNHTYIYTYTYIHIHIYIYIHTHIYCVYIYIYMYILHMHAWHGTKHDFWPSLLGKCSMFKARLPIQEIEKTLIGQGLGFDADGADDPNVSMYQRSLDLGNRWESTCPSFTWWIATELKSVILKAYVTVPYCACMLKRLKHVHSAGLH